MVSTHSTTEHCEKESSSLSKDCPSLLGDANAARLIIVHFSSYQIVIIIIIIIIIIIKSMSA